MRSPEHNASIDGLRGVAVLAVVLAHASPGPWHAISACGARGVDLFFVISGFCLAYPALAGRAAGNPLPALNVAAYLRFMRRRLSRIAPPYYVAIVALLIFASSHHGMTATASALLRDAGLDAAFVPPARPLLNGSFWTIGLEMRWYVLCPLLIALIQRSRIAFGVVALGCYALYALPYAIADEGTLPTFMLGIVAAELAATRSRHAGWLSMVTPPLVATALIWQARVAVVDHGNPLWAVAAFLLVVTATCGPLARGFAWRPLSLVGVASLSIYLVHQPALDLLARLGLVSALAAPLSVCAGAAFWALIERPLCAERSRRAIDAMLALPERIVVGAARRLAIRE